MVSLESMLYSGGDDRLHFDERTHFNKYMCTSGPNDILSFGSSTASTISPAGYEAAKILKARIEDGLLKDGERETYNRCLDGEVDKLRTICGFGREIDVMLRASGTDGFRALIDTLKSSERRPISVVIVAPEETGAGVYAVLSQVSQTGGEVVPIDVRRANGSPISGPTIDATVEAAVTEIVEHGGHAVLVLTDVSKTGLLVPSLAAAQEIGQRWPDRVSIVVDACQMRLSADTLRAYLARGWPTIITGSKFWAGPPFSGALLTPRDGVFAGWTGGVRRVDDPLPNFGMLLRWEAALTEASRFLSLPSAEVRRFIEKFGAAVQSAKRGQPGIFEVDVPAPDRSSMIARGGWDELQTLFPIGLRSGGRSLSYEELSTIYRGLAREGGLETPSFREGMRIHLGQPVRLGRDPESARWALRFSVSGRMVADALATPALQEVIFSRLAEAFDRLAWTANAEAPHGLSAAT